MSGKQTNDGFDDLFATEYPLNLYRHTAEFGLYLYCAKCHRNKRHMCEGDSSRVKCEPERHGVCTSCGVKVKNSSGPLPAELDEANEKPSKAKPAFLKKCTGCGVEKPGRWIKEGLCTNCFEVKNE